jgi:hypothetical protein
MTITASSGEQLGVTKRFAITSLVKNYQKCAEEYGHKPVGIYFSKTQERSMKGDQA